MAATVDTVLDEIRAIQDEARAHGGKKNPGCRAGP